MTVRAARIAFRTAAGSDRHPASAAATSPADGEDRAIRSPVSSACRSSPARVTSV